MSYIWLYDSWPSVVTLTLNWHMGNWAKIKYFFSISVGLTEQTEHNV